MQGERRPSRGVQFAEGVPLEGGGSGAPAPQLLKAGPLTEELLRELAGAAPQASPERQGQVEAAIADLLAACKAVAGHFCGNPAEVAASAVFPLGAQALGAAGPADEVDVLYVAPLSLQSYPAFAQALQGELVRGCGAKDFADAGSDGPLAAPGFRCELRGLALRVLVSQDIPGLPEPRPEALVQEMAGVYSLRALEKMKRSIPNMEAFQGLLRFVRHWAKRRGIYGGFLGFPGGLAWALCCAKVCQMYPSADLSQLVGRFFKTFTRWDWKQPVSLDAPPATLRHSSSAVPEYSTPLMVVQIPVGSGLSATTSVCETTMKVVTKEIRRGCKLLQQVEIGRAPWLDVYKEVQFFGRHRHYLQIDVLAANEAIFACWSSWARQRLPELVPLFEQMSGSIVTCRPWPDWVDFKDAEWTCSKAVFIGLHLERGPMDGQQDGQGARRTFDLREPLVKFLEGVSRWPLSETYAGQFELIVKHVRQADLQAWLQRDRSGASGTAVSSLGGGSAGGGQFEDTADGNEDDGDKVQNCSV